MTVTFQQPHLKFDFMKSARVERFTIKQPLSNPNVTVTNVTLDDLKKKILDTYLTLRDKKKCSEIDSKDTWLFSISLLLYSVDKNAVVAGNAIEAIATLLSKTQNDFIELPGDFSGKKMKLNKITRKFIAEITHNLIFMGSDIVRLSENPQQIIIMSHEQRFIIFDKLLEVRLNSARAVVKKMLDVILSKFKDGDVELLKIKNQVEYCLEGEDICKLLRQEKKSEVITKLATSTPAEHPSLNEVNRVLKERWPQKTPLVTQEGANFNGTSTIFTIMGCYCQIHKRQHTSNGQFVSWTVNPSSVSINYKCHHLNEGETEKKKISLFYKRR